MHDPDALNNSVPATDALTSSSEDSALLMAIARREVTALGQLYDRRGGLLFALCLRVLKDRMAAEEALEDIFWELWTHADRYDASRGAALSYMLSLTHSRAVDKLRSGARHRRLELDTDRAAKGSSAGAPVRRDVNLAGPVDNAVDQENRECVREALTSLPSDQRQAVEMAFFDGLTHVQIAEKLEQPLGTIKTRIRQALVRLRKALGARFEQATLPRSEPEG